MLLSDFLREGILLINRFLKLKRTPNDQVAIKLKMYAPLQKNLTQWRDKLSVSDEVLAGYCVDLFKDVSIVEYSEEIMQALASSLDTAMESFNALEDLLRQEEVAYAMNKVLLVDSI